MNRAPYKPPPVSRASATTQCQKCLKRGHFSYECKASVQERPYVPRPSRTQVLRNPGLAPKLASEDGEKLGERKGIADAVLAEAKAARNRKRSRSAEMEMDAERDRGRKRARSVSETSSSSVLTISTTASRARSFSRSPPRRRRDEEKVMTSQVERDFESAPRKRWRDRSAESKDDYRGRSTRRRRGSRSPPQRGRKSSRDEEARDRERRRESRRGTGDREWTGDREMGSRRSGAEGSPLRNGLGSGKAGTGAMMSAVPPRQNRPARETQPQRSLSPYSRRLALTQAMNAGS